MASSNQPGSETLTPRIRPMWPNSAHKQEQCSPCLPGTRASRPFIKSAILVGELVAIDPKVTRSQRGESTVQSWRCALRSAIVLLLCFCAIPSTTFGQKNVTILNTFPGDKGPGTKVLPDNVGGV